MNKKVIKENREKLAKAIVENFGKTYNKIKRVDESGLYEFDNYPPGADSDPRAPWHDQGTGHEDDRVDSIIEIATLTGFEPPLDRDSMDMVNFEATTIEGGHIKCSLGNVIENANVSDEEKMRFLSFIKENSEFTDDLYINESIYPDIIEWINKHVDLYEATGYSDPDNFEPDVEDDF